MGRPYKNEIRSLPDTYQWAVSQDNRCLKRLFSDHRGATLIAAGSGGSFSTASSAAALHRFYHRSPGYAVTPLELETSAIEESRASLWLFSGSGRNIDIRRCVKSATSERNRLTIFCGKRGSPLEREAKRAFVDRIFSFDTELGKDGYLATNSLFASSIILSSVFSRFPSQLSEMLKGALGTDSTEEQLRRSVYAAAINRSNAIILHGPSSAAGALDLESKCTEGAIVASSVADYRNFAHGRHNWINRFGGESFVVAYIGRGEEELARRTLELVPDEIPRVEVLLGNDFAIAQTLSLYFSIQIAGWLGEVHDIDPGRPHIPTFGRQLYHLRTRLSGPKKRRTPKETAIERKIHAHGVLHPTGKQLKDWSRHYTRFRKQLNAATIGAVVFDYDGTLVNTIDRFDPPIAELVERLESLLVAGLPIGIATGRGDSLRDDLGNSIDRELHSNILVGYNNASKVLRLDNEPVVDGDIDDKALAGLYNRLKNSPSLSAHLDLRPYPKQLSLRLSGIQDVATLWAEVYRLASDFPAGSLKIMISGHSIDVVPGQVTKLALVRELSEQFGVEESSILCIGDSGRWPGNDAELLGQPLSLSVDRVSADPETCWNLLPPRCRGVNGVLHYLERISNDGDVFRITI